MKQSYPFMIALLAAFAGASTANVTHVSVLGTTRSFGVVGTTR